MKLSEFSRTCQLYVPTGLAYRAQGRDAYNANNTIESVLLLIPPRQWSFITRSNCAHRETVEFWIGIPAPLKQKGVQQWANYSPIDARDIMMNYAAEFVQALAADDRVHVISEGIHAADFFDAPEGSTANNMTWVRWRMDVMVYQNRELPDGYGYVVDENGNYVYDYRGFPVIALIPYYLLT